MAFNKEHVSLFNLGLNTLLKVRRELRASRNEERAEKREQRADAVHTKKYFGRTIQK